MSARRTDSGLAALMFGPPAPFPPGVDPLKAPAVRVTNSDARPWSRRRLVQNGIFRMLPGTPSLLFFVLPVAIGAPAHITIAGIAVGLVVGLGFVGSAGAADLPLWGRICYLVGYAAFTLGATWPLAGPYALSMSAYVLIAAATLLPWTIARVTLPLLTIFAVLGSLLLPNWTSLVCSVFGGSFGLLMGSGMESGRIRGQLNAAQDRIATLAVAAERERIARDLHDILGHSLTAIVVQADLAVRLADRDPAAAKAQIEQLQQVARGALADVRATTSGMRMVRLATEISAARSVLQAAGIDCRAPAALPELSDELSELYGYVVREAVTNVVRHASATWCEILIDASGVRIRDDGAGVVTDAARRGSGVRGLQERAARSGITVELLNRSPGAELVARPVGPT